MHRVLPALLLLAPLALGGCITVSGRAGMASIGSMATQANTRLGTDFSETVMLTGVGVGADWMHFFGWQSVALRGVTKSTDANGTPQRINVRINDNELTFGVPLDLKSERFSNLPVVVPGLSMAMRSTYVTGGQTATAFSFRPRVSGVVPLGRRITLSVDGGYSVPLFENETVGGTAIDPVKAGMSGPQFGTTLTFYLWPGYTTTD